MCVGGGGAGAEGVVVAGEKNLRSKATLTCRCVIVRSMSPAGTRRLLFISCSLLA